MEKNQHIKHLYDRFLDHSISPEEYDELLCHFGSDLSTEQLRENILQALEKDEAEIIRIHRDQVGATIRNVKDRLFDDHTSGQPKKRNYVSSIIPYIAAAMVLVIASISYTLFVQQDSMREQLVMDPDIAPGINRAVLTMADGEEIALSQQQEGVRTDDGGIRYVDGTRIKSVDAVQIVTLSTPVAGQYQVRLPDGTRAWLNASSSISYPTSFVDNQRKISITGEVYLEVAKDAARKFIVSSGHQEIEVLGTAFNINAYGDNGKSYTALAEGSLRIKNNIHGTTALLKPGEEATVSQSSEIAVNKVDVSQMASWKDGFYLLQNQPLSVFSKQIERWYDVRIDMRDKGDMRLSAMIPRDINLSEVLQAIELKTGVKFKIEGRRITAE